MDRETIYEPHPVTPERKAELRAQGYNIIDAIFAPQDERVEDAEQPQEKQVATPRRGRNAKG